MALKSEVHDAVTVKLYHDLFNRLESIPEICVAKNTSSNLYTRRAETPTNQLCGNADSTYQARIGASPGNPFQDKALSRQL
jgi:hypothetical protein